MASGNTIVLSGNLTRDPELKFLDNGTALASFGIAVNRRWPDAQGEWQEEAHFFDVTAWRELGENVAETLRQGDRVIIEGRLQYRNWEDKDTGEKRSKVDVVADEVGASLRWATASVTKNERKDDNRGDREPSSGSRRGGGSSRGNGGGSRRGSAPQQESRGSREDFDEEPF
jgi:single-strand DNA-binding protein